MKICKKCGEEKQESEFYKNKRAKDGLYIYCKFCHVAITKIFSKTYINTEKYKEYRKQYRLTEKNKKYRKEYNYKYRKENKEYYRLYQKNKVTDEKKKYFYNYFKIYQKTPEQKIKNASRARTRRLILSGKIIKLPCQVCGEIKSETHHPDYSKPEKVMFLCKRHHKEIHWD
jgi:hypothetical protein